MRADADIEPAPVMDQQRIDARRVIGDHHQRPQRRIAELPSGDIFRAFDASAMHEA